MTTEPNYTDAQIDTIAKLIADKCGNGMREKYEDVARQIVDLMAERQAAMRGQGGEMQRYTLQYRPDWAYNQATMMPTKDGDYVKWDDVRTAFQPPQPVRSSAEVIDRVAKAIADAAGHGMREKCEHMAHAAIAVYQLVTWKPVRSVSEEDVQAAVIASLTEYDDGTTEWDGYSDSDKRHSLRKMRAALEHFAAIAQTVDVEAVRCTINTLRGATSAGMSADICDDLADKLSQAIEDKT